MAAWRSSPSATWLVAYSTGDRLTDNNVLAARVKLAGGGTSHLSGQPIAVDPTQREFGPQVATLGESFLVTYTKTAAGNNDVWAVSVDPAQCKVCEGTWPLEGGSAQSGENAVASQRNFGNPSMFALAVFRLDSALRLNVHFHVLWPDGVFTYPPDRAGVPATFHPADPPSEDDIAALAEAMRRRVLRYLRRRGALPAEDDDPVDASEEPALWATLAAAAVQGRRALGPTAGAYAARLGRGTQAGGEFGGGKLCAYREGFSLHAGVRIPGYCRERLERLQPHYDIFGPRTVAFDRDDHTRRASVARGGGAGFAYARLLHSLRRT